MFCLAPNRVALGGLSEHRRASECGSSPCALRIVEDLARYCFTRSTPFYLRVCCGLLPASQVRTRPRPRLCPPLHVSRTADTSPTHQVHGVRRPRHTLPASRLPQGWSRVPAPGRGPAAGRLMARGEVSTPEVTRWLVRLAFSLAVGLSTSVPRWLSSKGHPQASDMKTLPGFICSLRHWRRDF